MLIRHATELTALPSNQYLLPKRRQTSYHWPLLSHALNQRLLSHEAFKDHKSLVKERERTIQHRSKDIYIDSLQATLEAHRATNSAKLIRKVAAPPDRLVKHLKLPKRRDALNAKSKSSKKRKSPASNLEKKVHGEYWSKEFDYDYEPLPIPNGRTNPWDYWPPGSAQYNELHGPKKGAKPGYIREYITTGIKPSGPWRVLGSEGAVYSQRPWLNHIEKMEEDPLLQLANEIKAFEKYVQSTGLETQAVEKLASDVRAIIHDTFRGSSTQIIGSRANALAVPSSDIDFAISLPDLEHKEMKHGLRPQKSSYQKSVVRGLRKLHYNISNVRAFRDVTLVRARVPIVKATHRWTGWEVQLQVHSRIFSQQQFTLAYLSEFPLLRPLYFVLRSCLESRRLHITYEGGVGSYTLFIMIVNALKHASGKQDHHDLGVQLLHVLKFYATSDLYRDGFSADPPHVFHKDREYLSSEADREKRADDPLMQGIDVMRKLDLWRPYLLCLQDPANSYNDLGRNAYAIKHVQETFGLVRGRIILAMRDWERETGIKGERLSEGGLLSPLLEANYRIYDQFRLRAEGFVQNVKNKKPPLQSRRNSMTASEMLRKMDKVEKRIAISRAEISR